MGNKTTQRRLSKSVPKSRALAVASFVDGGLRINLNPNVDPEEVTTQPEIPGELVTDDDEQTGSATDGPSVERQRKHIMALVDNLKDLGQPMDRDERLSYYSQITGRSIDSTNQLTYGEAAKVIAAMTAFKNQQEGQ